MEVVILEDAEQIGHLGAAAISRLVSARPDAVIGLATGSSPVVVYDALGQEAAAGRLDLGGCTFFLLDEYVGLPAEHPQAYRNVIRREFADKVGVAGERIHGPDGGAADVPAACAAYERAIADAGGVDLQILGVGTDGHIAFNEPGSSLASRTRVKTLTRQTREDNARFFEGDTDSVPQHCVTQGVGTIMAARHLLLVAMGRGKAEAIHRLVEGPVTAMWPATALQWHPHVTVLVDEAAASRLQLASYYSETYAAKPAWQGL